VASAIPSRRSASSLGSRSWRGPSRSIAWPPAPSERQREEARSAVLRYALRAWPVSQLRFADPLYLGVFPAIRRYRGTEGRGKCYIARGVEAADVNAQIAIAN
jgi:hypothetical protein